MKESAKVMVPPLQETRNLYNCNVCGEEIHQQSIATHIDAFHKQRETQMGEFYRADDIRATVTLSCLIKELNINEGYFSLSSLLSYFKKRNKVVVIDIPLPIENESIFKDLCNRIVTRSEKGLPSDINAACINVKKSKRGRKKRRQLSELNQTIPEDSYNKDHTEKTSEVNLNKNCNGDYDARKDAYMKENFDNSSITHKIKDIQTEKESVTYESIDDSEDSNFSFLGFETSQLEDGEPITKDLKKDNPITSSIQFSPSLAVCGRISPTVKPIDLPGEVNPGPSCSLSSIGDTSSINLGGSETSKIFDSPINKAVDSENSLSSVNKLEGRKDSYLDKTVKYSKIFQPKIYLQRCDEIVKAQIMLTSTCPENLEINCLATNNEKILQSKNLYGENCINKSNLDCNMLNESVEKRIFTCLVCAESFTKESILKKHMLTHSEEKVLPINMCETTFTQESNVKISMPSLPVEKPFSCDVCCKSFNSKAVMRRHSLLHLEEKPFTCIVCEASFTNKTYLKYHMQTHSSLQPYQCSECDKSYRQKGNLTKHMQIHSGHKPFSCNLCEKSFSQKQHLQQHTHIHTGEKLFTCDICNKSFIQMSTLINHRLVHSSEKPFACNICVSTFKYKVSLKMHMQMHSGEKPFSCVPCNKKFRLKCSLKYHIYVHHRDQFSDFLKSN